MFLVYCKMLDLDPDFFPPQLSEINFYSFDQKATLIQVVMPRRRRIRSAISNFNPFRFRHGFRARMAEDMVVRDSNIHANEGTNGDEDSTSLRNENRHSNSSISLLSEPPRSTFVRFYRQQASGTVDYILTDASALEQSLLDASRAQNQAQRNNSSFQNLDDLHTPAVVQSSSAFGMSPSLSGEAQASSERRVSETKFFYIPDMFGANCLQHALEAPSARSRSQAEEQSQENGGFWNEARLAAEKHRESNAEIQVKRESPRDTPDFDDSDYPEEEIEICDCKRVHLTRPSSGSLNGRLQCISLQKDSQRSLMPSPSDRARSLYPSANSEELTLGHVSVRTNPQ